MPAAEARAKLKAYRADRHKDAEFLYKQTAKAFEALAKGTPIIKLSEAIRAGGFFIGTEQGSMPKLAFARADAREVKLTWGPATNEGKFTSGVDTRPGLGANLDKSIDFGRPHTWINTVTQQPTWLTRYALVPMVPADVRPKVGLLRDFYTLFEVERWYQTAKFMAPPADPLLLKHLGGDLYAVLAEWNLTEIERAVLANVRDRQERSPNL